MANPTTTKVNILCQTALDYAAGGLEVFPIKAGQKAPPLTMNGLKGATTDPEAIKRWWGMWPKANIGIRCTGLLVPDFDGKIGSESKAQLEAKFGKLPATWTIKTGGGTLEAPKEQGLHHVYKVKKDLNVRPEAGKYGYPGFDIRANDSYIVAAPSVTRLPYETIDDSPIADAPDWLIDIAKAGRNGSKPGTKVTKDAPIPDGQRNDTMSRIAGAMRRQGADQEAIEAALLNVKCQTPLPEDEIKAIAASISRYEPRPDGDEPQQFHLTDSGNARRLANQFGKDIRYSPERKQWLVWNGKVWEWDIGGIRISRLAKKVNMNIYHEAGDEPDDERRKDLTKHARETERQVRLDAMIKSAESESNIAIMLVELDANHYLLNVNNGTIDLKTGVVKRHDPADLITELLPIDYDPEATSAEWDAFLLRIFAGDTDLISYIQRAMGYSITGDQGEQVFFFCYGRGFNGKSTLLNACRLVMGNYATQVPPTAFMVDKTKRGGPDEAISSLKNKRLVCSTELEDGQRLSVSLVKRMTGGEPLWCEHKFERGYTFQPTHKLWLSGNHEPIITDTTNSIWYWLKKIPFTVAIPEDERQKGYAEKLVAEHAPAILAWLVKGCVEWAKAGGLGEPEAVKQAVAEYRDQQDILHDYLMERCLFKKNDSMEQKSLYADYKKWAEDNDVNAIGKLNFRARIQEKGAISDYGNKHVAVWRGIRLLTSEDNVNSVNSVTENPQSLLRKASTGETLQKTVNKINTINTYPEKPCIQCGTDEPVIDEKTGAYKCSKCQRFYPQPKGCKDH